ncbi:uncharacterized protein [Asterias amurensis]|uniref:uncharacterized protein n=1 Tax=Asterias amurensis TaxID=7602 RepID=UPI003AB2678E
MAADFSIVVVCLLVAFHAVSVSVAQTVDQFSEAGGLEGSTVRLFCQVIDRGNYGVFWYIEAGELLILSFDSADYVTNRPKFKIEEDLTSGYFNLTVRDLKMADEGLYECLLSDGTYTINGKPGTVKILPPVAPPGDPVCSPSYRTPLSEGDEISASCTTASGGRPNSQLTWQGLNGQVGLAGHGPNHTVIWDATPADDGAVFTCHEEHPALDGYDRSCTIGPLIVLYAPSVMISPSHPKSKLGELITLTCSASANPPIQTIHWFHGNTSLPIPMSNSTNSTTSRFSIEEERDSNGTLLSSHLNITEVRNEDFSTEITCRVWNANASRNITVTLKSPTVRVKDNNDVDNNSLARNPLLLVAVDLSALGGLALIGILFLAAPHLGCLVSDSYRQKRREKQLQKQLKREKKLEQKEKKRSSKRENNLVPIQFEEAELEMYEQPIQSGLQDNSNNNAEESAGRTPSDHSRNTSLSKLSNCVVEVDNTILEITSP